MENYDVPVEVKKQIVSAKIAVINNSIYDAGLDAKVAKVIGDERGEKVATERVKSLLKAIEELEGILEELDNGPTESGV